MSDPLVPEAVTSDEKMEEYLKGRDFKRLDIARAKAEKWVGAVTALTGLVGVVTIVKGADAAKDLSKETRATVALWLGGSFVLLVLGVLLIYAAAYGNPFITDKVERQPPEGLRERVLAQVQRDSRVSRSLLGLGLLSVVAGLCALLFASYATWVPPDSTGSSKSVCLFVDGTVVASVNGSSLDVNKLNGAEVGPCP